MRRSLSTLALALLCALTLIPGCGGGQAKTEAPAANPVRERIERQVKALSDAKPLQLRYNPAACDCPPFELRLPGGWIRVAWINAEAPEYRPLLSALGATTPEAWPVRVEVLGKVEAEVQRTVQGGYALRLESSRLLTLAPAVPDSTPPGAAMPANRAKGTFRAPSHVERRDTEIPPER